MIYVPSHELTMPGLLLTAPASGVVEQFSHHPEPIINTNTLGDGLAIALSNYQVYAPVTGKVVKIQNGGKELLIATKHGVILLLSLYTEPNSPVSFQLHAKQGELVSQNQLLISYNFQQVNHAILSVVLTNSQQFGNCYYSYDKVSACEDPLFKITAKKSTK